MPAAWRPGGWTRQRSRCVAGLATCTVPSTSTAKPSILYCVQIDGWPVLGDTAIQPGESRRLGFVFLSGEETAKLLRDAGKFFLWEGGFIGEAVAVLGASVATPRPGSL